MKTKTWYEVFESAEAETQTIKIFKTLKTARRFKRMELGKDRTRELHIDKWRNPENPEEIQSIE